MRTRLICYSLAGAALLFATAQPAAAQDTTVGVKVGVNFATLDFDEGDTEENKGRTGLVAGVFFTRPIQGGFGVQIEGLISQKGTKVEDNFFDEELDIKINYLEIPVLARYELPFGTGDSVFHVYAGPTFGVKLSDTQELDGEELDGDFERDIKGSDIGLAFGGGVSFNMWVIDLRYTHGLTNINDDFDTDEFDVKNRAFTIAVGYRFR